MRPPACAHQLRKFGLSVRACVAHTIAACLRHARPTAYQAFERLIEADDLLLASDMLDDLMIYIGNADPEVVDSVIDRMLSSTNAEVRRAGGCMAAFAALQWERPAVMERALAADVEVRSGLAGVCAARIDRSADSKLVLSTLRRLMHDEDDEVRKEVGTLADHLRGNELRPYAELLAELIASRSYVHATPQLLITLQARGRGCAPPPREPVLPAATTTPAPAGSAGSSPPRTRTRSRGR